MQRLSVPFQFQLPTDDELRQELRYLIGDFQTSGQLKVELTRNEADRLVEHLRGLSLAEVRRAIQRAVLDDGRLDGADLERILHAKQETLGGSGLLEFHAPVEDVPVGGMGNLRTWLEKRRAALSQEARAFGLDAPKGILLLGVQGCGKSLLARSVSATWSLPLVRLDPGALFDKFIGETEKNLRRALDAVEAMAPAVLWIDE
ncbi:MAG: AAA+ superfamily predicted ATPase [Chlamydiales bacterium]